MSPSEQTLTRIAQLSTKLNAETEELNAVIRDLDKRLDATKIGVAVWSGRIVDVSSTVEWNDDEERDVTLSKGWELGYAKVDDQWALAVKPQQGTDEPDERSNIPVTTWVDAGEPIRLLKAARIVRVEAAPHLESVLELIAERAAKYIEDIEKAKRLA
ncbi:MAG TPA: hypothetical protein VGK67_31390 [Myxococcales bacterium]|jgi:hypothetical protein